MLIIAFIIHSADIWRILNHIGVESEPPEPKPSFFQRAHHGAAAKAQTARIKDDWEPKTRWLYAVEIFNRCALSGVKVGRKLSAQLIQVSMFFWSNFDVKEH
ncbi:MAG: hypothetical protein H7293_19140 [Candidatus Saccharibacteria bacterium]|nr:hypothetical protein [Rhodoferax sp.]